ncbi:MAG: outer-membrane lipoprotein carrier protein LolA [Elusimicrobiota bacterium]|nr:outer-membrane lipoprotein carrier protein LolA [Endomicrobiia bacterium]MDW8165869.1 outer-membrane lipoprotein carrier protein LolA [Elusimicrobiota bacterium]
MKKIKKNFKFFLIFFLTLNFSFSIELKDLIEKIKQKESQINSIKANYSQIINFVDLNEVYEIKADFLYVRPDKVKIELYSPIRQIIVADSNVIYVKDILNDIIYKFNSKRYFEKEHNYLPLIFSKKNMKYTVVDFIKKTGLKLVAEEEKYYVLSTKYSNKLHSKNRSTLLPKETKFVMWLDKDTLFPRKISMVSEKYIVETDLQNYEVNFEYLESEFEIEKSTNTKIIEIK